MAAGWVERVIAERDALKERMDKLALFIETDAFRELSIEKQGLLQKQLVAMSHYNSILTQRIELEHG